MVAVKGPTIDKIVSKNLFYRHATIPGGIYTGTDIDTHQLMVWRNVRKLNGNT